MSDHGLDLFLSEASPKLAARRYGARGGKPVLALHGWLDNAASFGLLAKALGEGLDLVALDFPGHGHSDHRSADALYPFVDWAGDVERAADALGWSRFTLLGHSLGAAVAGLFAGIFPERVERLCAIEGLAPLTSEAEDLPAKLRLHFAARKARPGKRVPRYATEADAIRARIALGEFPVGEWIEAVVRRGLKPVEAGFEWRTDPRLRLPSAQRLTRAQALSVLAEIRCPSMFVRARQGIPIPPEGYAAMTAAVKGLVVAELDGGHHVHMEKPVEVARLVGGFLRG